MIQEETIIRQHDSGRSPFRVPEGYFDTFGDRLAERLHAERATVVRMNPLRRWVRYAAAAVVAGVCIGTGAYLYTRPAADALLATDATEYVISADDLDDALDYEMLDNQQIAYYLTEAY